MQTKWLNKGVVRDYDVILITNTGRNHEKISLMKYGVPIFSLPERHVDTEKK